MGGGRRGDGGAADEAHGGNSSYVGKLKVSDGGSDAGRRGGGGLVDQTLSVRVAKASTRAKAERWGCGKESEDQASEEMQTCYSLRRMRRMRKRGGEGEGRG